MTTFLYVQIAAVFVKEITEGIEGSGGVRCGFIGEMGCSYPLTPSEEKGLRAAAMAQRKTGREMWQVLASHKSSRGECPHFLSLIFKEYSGKGTPSGPAILSFVQRLSFFIQWRFSIECVHVYFQFVLCWEVCPLLECPLSSEISL